MNKLAVITGASSGIGYELAKIFAQKNYDLVINSHSEKISEKATLLREFGVKVTEVNADLATPEGVDQLFTQITSLARPVDVAVLNAGVGQGGEFINTNYRDELNLMNLNMVNLVYLTKKIVKEMAARNEGKILFTSSLAAETPGPYYAVYAASKAFVQSFAQALRFEMKDTHKYVFITALQPGPTDTNFFRRAEMLDTKAGEGEKDDPSVVAQQGYDALMNNEDHVVAGSIKNKMAAVASKVLSEESGAKAQGESAKPQSLQ